MKEDFSVRFGLKSVVIPDPNWFLAWLFKLFGFPIDKLPSKDKRIVVGFRWTGQDLVYPRKNQWVAECEGHVFSGSNKGIWKFVFPLSVPAGEVLKGYTVVCESLGMSALYNRRVHSPVQDVNRIDSIISQLSPYFDEDDRKDIVKDAISGRSGGGMMGVQEPPRQPAGFRRRQPVRRRSYGGGRGNYAPSDGGDVGG